VIRKLSWGEWLINKLVLMAFTVPISTVGLMFLQHAGTTEFIGLPPLSWQQAVGFVLVIRVVGDGEISRFEFTETRDV
jgi:hypothetical protein